MPTLEIQTHIIESLAVHSV